MPKFQVGDVVRIRPDIAIIPDEFPSINSDMREMGGGSIVTIGDWRGNGCYYSVDENPWVWLEEWLEPLDEGRPLKLPCRI